MSYSVTKTSITLTRGDTFKAKVEITDSNGAKYNPEPTDHVRFAMKKTYADAEPLILKDIPVDTMILKLDPEDTKDLAFGTYVYDIQLTNGYGEVDTFITKAEIKLTEEVH